MNAGEECAKRTVARICRYLALVDVVVPQEHRQPLEEIALEELGKLRAQDQSDELVE